MGKPISQSKHFLRFELFAVTNGEQRRLVIANKDFDVFLSGICSNCE